MRHTHVAKTQIDFRPFCRTTIGRDPLAAHTAVNVPCCPKRASSWNHTRTFVRGRVPCAFAQPRCRRHDRRTPNAARIVDCGLQHRRLQASPAPAAPATRYATDPAASHSILWQSSQRACADLRDSFDNVHAASLSGGRIIPSAGKGRKMEKRGGGAQISSGGRIRCDCPA